MVFFVEPEVRFAPVIDDGVNTSGDVLVDNAIDPVAKLKFVVVICPKAGAAVVHPRFWLIKI